MNQNREEAEALRRIEELLSKAQDASPPEAAAVTATQTQQQDNIPVNPEAIAEAEEQAAIPANALETISATLQQILAEIQTIANDLSRMAE